MGEQRVHTPIAHGEAGVDWLSHHYGKLIDGWLFDSPYSLDPRGRDNKISADLDDWQFPWESLFAAAKSGNPNSLVAFNSGIDCRHLYTRHQRYPHKPLRRGICTAGRSKTITSFSRVVACRSKRGCSEVRLPSPSICLWAQWRCRWPGSWQRRRVLRRRR